MQPLDFYTFFFFVISLITKSVAMVRTIPTGKQMNMFLIQPAKRNITKEIAATVIAYGICVDTWLMWLH